MKINQIYSALHGRVLKSASNNTKGKEKNLSQAGQFYKKLCRGNFPKEALFHVLQDGSLTLETALVFPLFLFAAATMVSLFLMMQVQFTIGNALDRAVADTALLRKVSETKAEVLLKAAFYKELARQKGKISLVQYGAAGFSWKGTKVDCENIDALVAYEIRFPIRFFGKAAWKVAESCRMHRWTGFLQGKSDSTQEAWVFVTPTQSVYHSNRDCTHLKLSVKSMAAAKLKKNSKYGPCGHCTKGEKMGTTVYVTEEGDCYHFQIGCSGLKRTIYMIAKAQAADMKPCSRCGGR